MTLQQLRDFLSVMEHGSFRAAARFSGVSQAGLTHSLKALETSLGTALMIRNGRGVQLTPAGDRLRQRALLIDAEATRATNELGGQEGVLRIGFSPTPSALLLPKVVPLFRSRFPRSELRLMGGLFEKLLPAVRTGQLDFAVISLPDAGINPGMRSQVLMKAEMAVVARRDHPLKAAWRLDELAGQEWILMGPAGAPGGTVIRFFQECGLPRPHVAVVCDSFTQVTSLLAGSDYLALMPRLVLESNLLGQSIVEIKIREQARGYDVALIQRSEVPLVPAAMALAAMLTSCARSVGQVAPPVETSAKVAPRLQLT